MKEKNDKFKIIIFLLIVLGIVIEFYPYKNAIKEYFVYKSKMKLYDEDKEVLFPDGILKYKKIGGRKEYYYRNGSIKKIEEKNKDDIYYDIGGNIIDKSIDKKNEIKNGVEKIYSPNGNLVAEYKYKDGKLDGIQKVYFIDSTNIFLEENYKLGEKIGEQKYYFKNGEIEIYEKYDKSGQLEIKKEFFFSGEEKYSYDFTQKDKRQIIKYDEKSKKIKEKEIILYSDDNEVVEKTQEYYNENGNKSYTTKEIRKINLEEVTSYYENGNIQYIYYELFGERMPIGKTYYENGNLAINNYYDKTNKKLISEKYYEDGKLESKTIHKSKDIISEIDYYIEYSSDGKKFYEITKIKGKKIERFYGKTEKILYEKEIEGDE